MVLLGSAANTLVSRWLTGRFIAAALSRSAENFRLLVSVNAHGIARWGATPLLHLFARHAFEPGVEFLINDEADVNAADQEGWTPLQHATDSCGDEQAILATIKLLLDAGARMTPFPGGATLLEAALFRNSPTVAKALIRGGADVNARGSEGKPPLLWHLSRRVFSDRRYSALAALDLLLAEGASLRTTPGRLTALHLAVRNSTPEMVERLVDHGIPVDVPGPGMQTPLFCLHGANEHSDEILEVLIRRGADWRARDSQNRTATEVAEASGDFYLAFLLTSRLDELVARRRRSGKTG